VLEGNRLPAPIFAHAFHMELNGISKVLVVLYNEKVLWWPVVRHQKTTTKKSITLRYVFTMEEENLMHASR